MLQRPRLLKAIGERIAHRTAAELASSMEKAGLPFAPIKRPEDLYDDEHLLATGGLADVRLPDGPKAGETVKTTLFPITWAATAWACGWIRRGWANTPASCWTMLVLPAARSTNCWPGPWWPEAGANESPGDKP